MAQADVPVWLQILLAAGGFAITLALAILSGRKAAGTTSEGQATVLAGAIADPKQINRIVESIDSLKALLREIYDQRHRDSVAERDALESHTRALKSNTDAVQTTTFDPRMLSLLGQLRDR